MNINDINWQPISKKLLDQTPPHLKDYLAEEGSLISLLENRIGMPIDVLPTNQAWCHPSANEAKLMKINSNRPCWVRDVTISHNNKKLILAHSIFPPGLLNNTKINIQTLGEKPLATILFGKHQATRDKIYLGKTTSSNSMLSSMLNNKQLETTTEGIWGKLSEFIIEQYPVIVYEFFIFPSVSDN